jgi:hypothetical protein
VVIRAAASHVDADKFDTGDYLLRAQLEPDPVKLKLLTEEFEKNKGGYLSWNWIDAGIKLRPSTAEVVSIGSGFQDFWKLRMADKPDKALVNIFTFAVYYFFFW